MKIIGVNKEYSVNPIHNTAIAIKIVFLWSIGDFIINDMCCLYDYRKQ